ncbi:MAG: SocA family protein [Proteobacteria bacterium]|nr:SocA family protein [Pseudomonadota bacterium]
MGPFQFDPEKATEALLYVARRVRDHDLYATLKVLYLADKHHLHRYGRFIFGDAHHALPHGPVPQGAYDILKWVRGDDGRRYEPARHAMRVEGNTVMPLRDAEADVFSSSDLECLERAIEEFGRLPFGKLKEITHDAAYNATHHCAEIAIEAIAALADDQVRVPLIQHLADPHPGE